eukprot:scaffold55220_cov19-Prasinocladus_malaysianus.AAC.4
MALLEGGTGAVAGLASRNGLIHIVRGIRRAWAPAAKRCQSCTTADLAPIGSSGYGVEQYPGL